MIPDRQSYLRGRYDTLKEILVWIRARVVDLNTTELQTGDIIQKLLDMTEDDDSGVTKQ